MPAPQPATNPRSSRRPLHRGRDCPRARTRQRGRRPGASRRRLLRRRVLDARGGCGARISDAVWRSRISSSSKCTNYWLDMFRLTDVVRLDPNRLDEDMLDTQIRRMMRKPAGSLFLGALLNRPGDDVVPSPGPIPSFSIGAGRFGFTPRRWRVRWTERDRPPVSGKTERDFLSTKKPRNGSLRGQFYDGRGERI